MAAAREVIGKVKCPCCGESCPVKKQSNGLPCVTCNYCNLFIQTHSKTSGDWLTQRMAPLTAAEKREEGGAPAPAPAKRAAQKKPERAPEPAREQEHEPTIFDAAFWRGR